MEHFQPGEVVLLSFPFSDAFRAKRRPALVLRDTGDEDVIAARITSQVSQTALDIELADCEAANLILPSWVRVHKLATLQK
jgi:mRNA interferase MazF